MEKKLKSWSFLQSSEEIDVGRFFEYDEDALRMFSEWLSFLKLPKIRILEVGSGNGFFTNKLLEMFPEIDLVCLEPDVSFVKILEKRFGNRISIVNEKVEKMNFKDESFDAVISHIVIHNLYDPIEALNEMKRVIKSKGRLITIEPLPASRQYYPDKKIEEAADYLFKAQIIKTIKYNEETMKNTDINPWKNNYPDFFEKVGLNNITCHGWTSIFTLSDNRFDFKERKTWITNRKKLVESKKLETTKILIESGEKQEQIDEAYNILLSYFTKLEEASNEELDHIHEQEIVHRIIAIGQKT
ncbi:MAG TPA: class I SAM-dependent methyltransferase [candidate division Zixibacteria bacterium]|nr:class I SAM-dependent methyltransferase [candidate division Zixibacteria bacterium]